MIIYEINLYDMVLYDMKYVCNIDESKNFTRIFMINFYFLIY